jgi:DNA-binding NarL/FixJ family response regulator
MALLPVLLVGDSPSLLRILIQHLDKDGRGEFGIVGTALSGKEALIKAQELRPDVVVMDLAIPDFPGLDALPRLRRILPEAGIIALTLLDSERYRQATLAAGANDLVSKTRLVIDLLPAIRRLGEGRQPRREWAKAPEAATG